MANDTSLTENQVEEMKTIYNIDEIAPYKTASGTISKGKTTSNKASIIATNDCYLAITNLSLAKGRNISVIDHENKSKVCILGAEIAETLFNLANPVGETIQINGDHYTVIGVLNEQGSNMGNNIDSHILIPLGTAKYLGEDAKINQLYVKVADESTIERSVTQLENYIRQTLQISSDDYSVETQDSMLDAMENINDTLALLLGGIASISLIVGGIGVMNVMLVSVTERIKEIGIRKSLGAKKSDILIQFLLEAFLLSMLGGIIGIAIGLLVGNGIEQFGYSFEGSTQIIFISFVTSAMIGLIFGIFPAYRAAKLNPIDALRHE